MARVLAWMELSRAAFPNEQAILLYLLHLLKDNAANWAEPHLQKVLEMRQGSLATIQEFVEHFYNAFDNPDAERATERKIQELSQETVSTKSTAEYTTEFRNLAACWKYKPTGTLFSYFLAYVMLLHCYTCT
jgi:hypothetical protein